MRHVSQNGKGVYILFPKARGLCPLIASDTGLNLVVIMLLYPPVQWSSAMRFFNGFCGPWTRHRFSIIAYLALRADYATMLSSDVIPEKSQPVLFSLAV